MPSFYPARKQFRPGPAYLHISSGSFATADLIACCGLGVVMGAKVLISDAAILGLTAYACQQRRRQ